MIKKQTPCKETGAELQQLSDAAATQLASILSGQIDNDLRNT